MPAGSELLTLAVPTHPLPYFSPQSVAPYPQLRMPSAKHHKNGAGQKLGRFSCPELTMNFATSKSPSWAAAGSVYTIYRYVCIQYTYVYASVCVCIGIGRDRHAGMGR